MNSYITFLKEKKDESTSKRNFVENDVEIDEKLFEEENNFFINDAKENEEEFKKKIENFEQIKILKPENSKNSKKEVKENENSKKEDENQKENIDLTINTNEFKSDSITSEFEVNSKKRKLPASENVLKIFSKITKI